MTNSGDTKNYDRPSFKSIILWVSVILVVVFILETMGRGRRKEYITPRYSICKNRMKQIVLALHNYHDEYGSFPPAYIADEDGKPMHSWRTLLLPFMDGQDLYDEYDFSEPWNGPNNSMLHKSHASRVYRCSTNQLNSQFANYVAVIGKRTLWNGEKPYRMSGVTGDGSNTIFIVEIKNSDIHWLEPRDLRFDEMSFTVNGSHKNSLGSLHSYNDSKVFRACALDGACYSLVKTIPPDAIRALLTVNNDNKFQFKDYEP